MTNPNIAKYRAVLERAPENELARFSLGKAYFDEGDFRAADEQFQCALAKKPDWMVVVILLGKCHAALGAPQEARRYFERARQLAIEQNHEGPRAEMEELLAEM